MIDWMRTVLQEVELALVSPRPPTPGELEQIGRDVRYLPPQLEPGVRMVHVPRPASAGPGTAYSHYINMFQIGNRFWLPAGDRPEDQTALEGLQRALPDFEVDLFDSTYLKALAGEHRSLPGLGIRY